MTDNHQDPTISRLLSTNAHWAEETAHKKPDLFPSLSTSQHPSILWIGCSDSRVPETTICGLAPGDIFVHRNIANIIPPTDLSSASVIEYAVKYLHVKIVVVCGHEGCGGVGGALGNSRLGVVDQWLLPLRELRMKFWGELEGLSAAERVERLVVENVRAGVRTVRENTNVLEAGIQVVGLVYDIKTGKLREVKADDEEAVVAARKGAFVTN